MGMKVISKFFAVLFDSDTKSVCLCATVFPSFLQSYSTVTRSLYLFVQLSGHVCRVNSYEWNRWFGASNVLMDVFQLTFPPGQV